MSVVSPVSHLAGLLVTRPREQGLELVGRIAEAGGRVWLFPTIEIRPLVPDRNKVREMLEDTDWLIFVSANAVLHGWPWVDTLGPGKARLAAVGHATARRLSMQSQQPVLYPAKGADSESLLALPEWSAVAGKKIVIVRGQGGREWLKAQLEARGAKVAYLECYERTMPEPDLAVLDEALSKHALFSVQSAEALHNLWEMAGESRHQALRSQTFVVSHPRVAEAARLLEVGRIHVTEPGTEPLVTLWKSLAAQ